MQKSLISDIKLDTPHKSIGSNATLSLDLDFSIGGLIREIFSQKNWERAYDKHDNAFRLTVFLDVRAGGKSINKIKFVRKAVLFWTRNPKLSYRVWISIIKDETPYYPLTIEEAKALLFDVTKTIQLQGNHLEKGENEIKIDIKVSWGKHLYTEPTELNGQTETIKVNKV
ncbi:MAG TPA: hypothetical protein VJ599_10745 [Nitrososphaeraceae archaeon]|nr:hypothetical protein [Nitrososphaeraceae archaeon]